MESISIAIITGLISVLICIIPFMIVHYSRINFKNKLLKSLNDFADEHGCNISQYEFCRDFVLGMDEANNVVFFLMQKKDGAVFQSVNLSEIKICVLDRKIRKLKNYLGNLNFTEHLELNFIPSSKDKEEKIFVLFDSTSHMFLRGELKIGEKWSKMINERLPIN